MGLLVRNQDQRPHDYGEMVEFPRPSHADFTYQEKYGIRASSGGGRSSARETIARVAAGAIAEKCLSLMYGVEIVAFVSSVGSESLFPHTVVQSTANPEFLSLLQAITRQEVDNHLPVRCPNAEAVRPNRPSSSHHLKPCYPTRTFSLLYTHAKLSPPGCTNLLFQIVRTYGQKYCGTPRQEG